MDSEQILDREKDDARHRYGFWELSNKKMNGEESAAVKADAFLNSTRRLKDSEVRIITLPPATVASYRYEGEEPEEKAGAVIDGFVRKSNLAQIKPDLRRYGFQTSNSDETGICSYEMWVTIPDDFEVEPPLTKKKFEGGLYAAFMIPYGAFEGWQLLFDWLVNHDKYTQDYRGAHPMDELLDYVCYITKPKSGAIAYEEMRLDLLLPAKVMGRGDYSRSNLQGVENRKAKTLAQLEEEARQGDPAAQWDYGYCFFQGYNGTPIDFEKCVEWLQKSADQGYAKAQCTLGYCRQKGLGVQKSLTEAIELYEKAAAQNYSAAIANLGILYMNGEGVPRDIEKAKLLFEKVAGMDDNPRTQRQATEALKHLKNNETI